MGRLLVVDPAGRRLARADEALGYPLLDRLHDAYVAYDEHTQVTSRAGPPRPIGRETPGEGVPTADTRRHPHPRA